jgi:hypothetical protein
LNLESGGKSPPRQRNEGSDEATLPAGIARDGRGGFVLEDLDSFCQAVSVDNAGNVLDDECEELMEVGDEEMVIEVAIDSAAVANVAQKDIVPYICTVESEGSKTGKHYTDASGGSIENEGEMHMVMQNMEDQRGMKSLKTVFQACNVTRPLCSVSKVCDAHPDANVRFDAKQALVRRGKRVIATFKRRGGLYVARMKVKRPAGRPAGSPDEGFPGQGATR